MALPAPVASAQTHQPPLGPSPTSPTVERAPVERAPPRILKPEVLLARRDAVYVPSVTIQGLRFTKVFEADGTVEDLLRWGTHEGATALVAARTHAVDVLLATHDWRVDWAPPHRRRGTEKDRRLVAQPSGRRRCIAGGSAGPGTAAIPRASEARVSREEKEEQEVKTP